MPAKGNIRAAQAQIAAMKPESQRNKKPRRQALTA
jgi:hypothetical protein